MFLINPERQSVNGPPFFNKGNEGTSRAKGSIGFANTLLVIPANAWNPERKPTRNGPPFFNEGDEGTGRDKGSIGFANTLLVIPANAWNP